MPIRKPPILLKTVRVLESELYGLLPEHIAGRTPFTLVCAGSPSELPPRPSRSSPDFLGWTRLYIGIKSSSSQRRNGLWFHREDWVWLGTEHRKALKTMASMARGSEVVAVIEASAPVQAYEKNLALRAVGMKADVCRAGPVELSALSNLHWLIPRAALWAEGNQLTLEPLESHLHIKRYTRVVLRDGADSRGWRHAVI